MSPLTSQQIIEDHTIVLCCGSGGVGKTTTAASIALGAASRGKKTCVVTIDPARRLADALGLSGVANEPTRVDVALSGELYAVMLDAKQTFDNLIRRYASDDAQAERIFTNRLYRNLAPSLAGTQEYMASEKLYELHESGQFDCIVIDTPPSRATLDFFEAPGRMTHFVDNRLFRSLIGTSGYAKVLNVATRTVLGSIAKVTGSEIVDDAVAFFQAFSGMEEGFKNRAGKVGELLDADSTAYVLVTTPRRESIEEAKKFAAALSRSRHAMDLVVVNRVYPNFGPSMADESSNAASAQSWKELLSNLRDLGVLAHQERQLIDELIDVTGSGASVGIPIFPSDIHDLHALMAVARYLLGEEVPFLDGKNSDRQ